MQNQVWKENSCERWSGFYGLVAWPPFLRRCAAGESPWAQLQGQFLEGAITETDPRRAATVEKIWIGWEIARQYAARNNRSREQKYGKGTGARTMD
jgi:hypothetical protein